MALEIFDFVPDYGPNQITDKYNVITTEFESGVEQVRYKGRLPREWELQFTGTIDRIREIRSFFRRKKGAYPFLWKPFDADEAEGYIKVRFKDAEFTLAEHGNHVGKCKIVLREVLDDERQVNPW